MKTQLNGYFVIYDRKSEKLIAIDKDSGGYAYPTSDFRYVSLFFTEDSAQNYANLYKNDVKYDMTVKPLRISIGGL